MHITYSILPYNTLIEHRMVIYIIPEWKCVPYDMFLFHYSCSINPINTHCSRSKQLKINSEFFYSFLNDIKFTMYMYYTSTSASKQIIYIYITWCTRTAIIQNRTHCLHQTHTHTYSIHLILYSFTT